MAGMAWGALVNSAIEGSKKGAHDPQGTPDINPALDPGMYAFQLWFNKQRRQEEQANKDRAFTENQRQFNVQAGQQAQNAFQNAQAQYRQQNMQGMGLMAGQNTDYLKRQRQAGFVNLLRTAGA